MSWLPKKILIVKGKIVSCSTVDLEQAEKAQGESKEVKKKLF